MTWEQKAAALNALARLQVIMRSPGNWYASNEPRIEVANGSTLSGIYGNGKTPEEAIENHWRVLVEDLPDGKWLVINAMTDKRMAVRWNGFMWANFTEIGT